MGSWCSPLKPKYLHCFGKVGFHGHIKEMKIREKDELNTIMKDELNTIMGRESLVWYLCRLPTVEKRNGVRPLAK